MPWLTECIESLTRQSIGSDRIEVIAVDDESTDGSGAELDRLAEIHPCIRVVHQPNSGGPGGPRNVGIGLARGTYIYFVDADDYLGDEAVERVTAVAERNRSDIVLGKVVSAPGFGNRGAKSMWRHSVDDADLFASRVYYTLSPHKLVRREFIERHGLRFPEDLHALEDQLFVCPAYLKAKTISIVADYDCYYFRDRPDGGSVTKSHRHRRERILNVHRLLEIIGANVSPGADRDFLLHRHIAVDLLPPFTRRWMYRLDAAERAELADYAGAQLARWSGPRLEKRLPADLRLVAWMLRTGRVEDLAALIGADAPTVIEKDRAYRALPYFRDGERGVPDEVFDITDSVVMNREVTSLEQTGTRLTVRGRAVLKNVDPAIQETALVLRDRAAGRSAHVPVRAPGKDEDSPGTFVAEFDLTTVDGGKPVRDGVWELLAEVRAGDLVRQRRLHRPAAVPAPAPSTGTVPVTVATAPDGGPVLIEVGETYQSGDGIIRATGIHSTRARLRVDVTGGTWAPGVTVVLKKGGTEKTMRTSASQTGLRASIRNPVLRLLPGAWTIWVRRRTPDGRRSDVAVRTARGGGQATVRVMPKLEKIIRRAGRRSRH